MPTLRVLLLGSLLLVAIAVAAPSASADEAIVVHPEQGGTCNPCLLHMTGTFSITAFHVLPVTSCREELVATINSNGSGFIHDYTNQDNGGPGCTRQNCNGVGEAATESEWDISSEEVGPDTSEMSVQLCLDTKPDPNATGTHCTLDVLVAPAGSGDHYSFNYNQECAASGIPVRLTGAWTSEADPTEGQDVVIAHQ
jgi:hypothetical protein